MSELFCVNCGNRLEPGTVFCENCGTPVEDEAGQASAPPPPQGTPVHPHAPVANGGQSGQASRKWPIFVVIAIVAIAIIVAVVIFTQGEKPAESEDGAIEQSQEQSSSASSSASTDSSYVAAPSVVASAPVFTTVETSSVLAPDSTTSNYGGINVVDGLAETAWNEGAAGDGTGEWLELIAPSPQRVSSVSIMGGYPKPYRDGSDVYYKNNRPRQITISYDGGSQSFMLQDLRGQFQTCALSHPVETTFVRITINSVYKGANYDDCCIAEVKVS